MAVWCFSVVKYRPSSADEAREIKTFPITPPRVGGYNNREKIAKFGGSVLTFQGDVSDKTDVERSLPKSYRARCREHASQLPQKRSLTTTDIIDSLPSKCKLQCRAWLLFHYRNSLSLPQR
jgi:hypothetical protein